MTTWNCARPVSIPLLPNKYSTNLTFITLEIKSAHWLKLNVTLRSSNAASLTHITGNPNLRAVTWVKKSARLISKPFDPVIGGPPRRARASFSMNSVRFADITANMPFGYWTSTLSRGRNDARVTHCSETYLVCQWSNVLEEAQSGYSPCGCRSMRPTRGTWRFNYEICEGSLAVTGSSITRTLSKVNIWRNLACYITVFLTMAIQG